MEFGGDELDNFFGEEACDEFVKGININFNDADSEFLKKMGDACKTQEGQEIFSAVLIENDEMLKQAVFGKSDECRAPSGDFAARFIEFVEKPDADPIAGGGSAL